MFGARAWAQGAASPSPIPGLPFWAWQVNQPTGYSLRALHVFNDSTVIAGGGHGTAVKTTNRGRTWQVLDTGVDGDVTGASFADARTGWLAVETMPQTLLHYQTGPGRVLRTTDGGQTWVAQATGDNRSVVNPCILAVSPTEAYLTYDRTGTTGAPNYFIDPQGPQLLHTTNGGQTWLPLALPFATSYVGDLVFPTPAVGYMPVGNPYQNALLRTADHGQTWQRVGPSAANGGTDDFRVASVSFLDAQRGWALGGLNNAGASGIGTAVYRTTDGGQRWTVVPVPTTPGYPFGLSFANPLHGTLPAPVYNTSYTTSDGGLTWVPVTLPSQLLERMRFQLLPLGGGWAIGNSGALYGTANFGASWEPRTTPAPVSATLAVSFPDPTHGWALPITFQEQRQTVLRTARRGAPWQRQDLSGVLGINGNLWGGAFPDADTAWVSATIVNANTVFRTVDAGRSWAAQPLLAGLTSTNSMAAWDTRRLAVVTREGAVFVTRNGGRQWQGPTYPAGTRRQLYQATWADSATVYVTTDTLLLLKSTNAGRSWRQVPMPLGTSMFPYNRLTFTSAQVGYLAGFDWVWKTSDGAQTWVSTRLENIPLPNGLLRRPGSNNVAFSTARHGWTMGSIDVFETTDAGQTWSRKAYVGGLLGGPAGGSGALVDRYNAFTTGTGLARYSEKFVQADTAAAQPRRYCAGQDLTLAYTTEGTLSAAERASLRVQLSNNMGRFRPGQTWLLAPAPGGTGTALRATLPAALPPGSRYRLRVITLDSALLGGDNGRDLTISPLPAAVALSPAGPQTLCAGGSLTLSAPAGPAQYRWNTGATTRTLAVAAAGSYTVQVANAAGCFGPPSAAVAVAVQPLPVAPVLAHAPGGPVTVAAPVAGVAYEWFLNGVVQPGVGGLRFPAVGPAAVGAYTAVAVGAAGGCRSAPSAPVRVVLAVRGALPVGWALFPNPADERLTVDVAPSPGPVTLALRDALGRTVRTLTTTAARAWLDVGDLPAGTYWLQASRAGGPVGGQAVQVRH